MRSARRWRSRDPWKPHPIHAGRADAQDPRQPLQLPPAPLTPSPRRSQPLPAWRALAQLGCPMACTDQRCTCGNPVAPSSPPPDAMGALSLSAPLTQPETLSRDSSRCKTGRHASATTPSSTTLSCQANGDISGARSKMGPEPWPWQGGGQGCVCRNARSVLRSVH